ncbi:hypothetical protein AAFF_G00276450 [Aldrovandia affinis]|uniref:Uncharacterized protein n=1 Tax=Aldrovandia affinis TaxID=143900 RepID=A0AAD7RAC2_9TELE|nr:hypothetical protein AAFF_G00276450 [Aldrovandia affinis]
MEKLALALVLLIMCSLALSEASRDLTGKAFIFPVESRAHVLLVPAEQKNFTAVTSYTKGMNFRKGNVINWQDLKYYSNRNVVVELQLKGGGANQSHSYRDEPHWSGPVSRRTHDRRSVFT